MQDKSKASEKILQLEKYFKNSIKMAIQEMLSWSALVILLIDMAPNVVECQLLIKILLNRHIFQVLRMSCGSISGISFELGTMRHLMGLVDYAT